MGRELLSSGVQEAPMVRLPFEVALALGVDRAREFEMEHGPLSSAESDPSGRVVVPVSWQQFMPEPVTYRAKRDVAIATFGSRS